MSELTPSSAWWFVNLSCLIGTCGTLRLDPLRNGNPTRQTGSLGWIWTVPVWLGFVWRWVGWVERTAVTSVNWTWMLWSLAWTLKFPLHSYNSQFAEVPPFSFLVTICMALGGIWTCDGSNREARKYPHQYVFLDRSRLINANKVIFVSEINAAGIYITQYEAMSWLDCQFTFNHFPCVVSLCLLSICQMTWECTRLRIF